MMRGKHADVLLDIGTGRGTGRTVRALTYGPLSVHAEEYGPSRAWSITHRPTGCVVVSQIPSRQKAVAVVRRLRRLDWRFEIASQFKGQRVDRCRKVLIEMDVWRG